MLTQLKNLTLLTMLTLLKKLALLTLQYTAYISDSAYITYTAYMSYSAYTVFTAYKAVDCLHCGISAFIYRYIHRKRRQCDLVGFRVKKGTGLELVIYPLE